MSYNVFNPNILTPLFFQTFNIEPYTFDTTKYSLYEQMGQALTAVNNVIGNINNVGTAVQTFQNYILEQLSNYDNEVQQEVTTLLNNYITNGTIANLLNQTLFNQINNDITDLKNSVTLINREISDINYRKPYISLTIQPTNTIYNFNEAINSVILKFTVIKGTNNLVKAEVYKNTLLIATINDVINGENTFVDGSIINDDTIYSVKIYDDKDSVFSNEIFINFINNYYYGVKNVNQSIDSAFVKSLNTIKTPKTNIKQNFNCTNQKVIFAYPQSYGDLLEIMYDSINYLDSFLKTNISIDNVNYNVYSSINYLSDTIDLDFNFTPNTIVLTNQSNDNLDGGLF